jgi:hypothetical protein
VVESRHIDLEKVIVDFDMFTLQVVSKMQQPSCVKQTAVLGCVIPTFYVTVMTVIVIRLSNCGSCDNFRLEINTCVPKLPIFCEIQLYNPRSRIPPPPSRKIKMGVQAVLAKLPIWPSMELIWWQFGGEVLSCKARWGAFFKLIQVCKG